MIRKLSEGFSSDGVVTVYNINKDKIAKEVDKASWEAKTYVDSGDALPTWHWNIGEDDSNYYAIVLGFAEGYEPNEDEFCDSDGNHVEMKWAYIPKNSAMNEYDMDYMFPYNDDGDVWGTTIPVTGYGMQADTYYLLDDFKDYVKEANSQYADEYYESVRRNRRRRK